MKRLGFFASLFILLFSTPFTASARLAATPFAEASVMEELPWSVVDAVLHRVEQESEYSYSELVYWYQGGLCTVEQCGSSYVVTIYDEDGITDVIIIDHL